ncbi:MAG TPA: ABC transporter substrate-binding protein [Mycobacteriales bacterium]|nr:ABC transporter substrate-binding protein [Mycobacteriales bacterium]
MERRPVRLIVAVTAAIGLLVLTGCGAVISRDEAHALAGEGGSECTSSQHGGGGTPRPTKLDIKQDPAAAAKVPARLRSGGTLVIASEAAYAPNEFLASDHKTPIGMDIDLGRAISMLLGLSVQYVNTDFDGILGGLQAHKYDIGMSSFTDNKEREKSVDFVTYFRAGTSIMAKKCNPAKIKDDLSLCGKAVGAENGTIQLDSLVKAGPDSIVSACKKAKKSPPKGSGYPEQSDVNGALDAGRIQAYIADTPVVDYAIKVTGEKFQKVGKTKDVAPYGIAIPKDSGTLKDAVLVAVKKLMADGTYTKILKNWGVQAGAIDNPVINGAQG